MHRVARIAALALLLPACSGDAQRERSGASTADPAPDSLARFAPAAADPVVASGSVYVPVYSHIYYRDEHRFVNLAITLSVRNTDADHPIAVRSVRYYDTDGALVRTYVGAPARLGPMATREFIVGEKDSSGGSGANFVVDWSAAQAVSEPVVEAVMIGTSGAQGISFTSEGRVLQRWP
jgi:hypothetical protein